LTSVDRPPESSQDEENQDDGQRDEQIQDIHNVFQPYFVLMPVAASDWVKRMAFATTPKELAAIPSPANQAGSKPTTAKGTQAAL
jgi:hypothetical protein